MPPTSTPVKERERSGVHSLPRCRGSRGSGGRGDPCTPVRPRYAAGAQNADQIAGEPSARSEVLDQPGGASELPRTPPWGPRSCAARLGAGARPALQCDPSLRPALWCGGLVSPRLRPPAAPLPRPPQSRPLLGHVASLRLSSHRSVDAKASP